MLLSLSLSEEDASFLAAFLATGASSSDEESDELDDDSFLAAFLDAFLLTTWTDSEDDESESEDELSSTLDFFCGTFCASLVFYAFLEDPLLAFEAALALLETTGASLDELESLSDDDEDELDDSTFFDFLAILSAAFLSASFCALLDDVFSTYITLWLVNCKKDKKGVYLRSDI